MGNIEKIMTLCLLEEIKHNSTLSQQYSFLDGYSMPRMVKQLTQALA